MNVLPAVGPDVIAALATPPGRAARGLIRLSGNGSLAVAARVFHPSGGAPPEAWLSFRWIDGRLRWGERSDDVAPAGLVAMRAPRSYTREDMAEIHAPGNPLILAGALARLLASGARAAGPGEFTRRAYENGRLSLVQAEAVLTAIRAERDDDHRRALALLSAERRARILRLRDGVVDLLALLEGSLDFAEEGIDFFGEEPLADRIAALAREAASLATGGESAAEALPDGALRLLLVGKANAGKSTLFNRLVGAAGATAQIVSAVAGTTRDLVEARLPPGFGGAVAVDTPGLLEEGRGEADAAGQAILDAALARGPCVLFVADGARPWEPADAALYARCRSLPHRVAVTKSDRPRRLDLAGRVTPEAAAAALAVSALTDEGIPALAGALAAWLSEVRRGDPRAGRVAEAQALAAARAALSAARAEVLAGAPPEIAAVALREAAEAFAPLVGGHAPKAILDRLFSRFCIGK